MKISSPLVRILLTTAALIALVPLHPHAQTPTLQSTTSLVLIPALVRTADGELVHTLHADDFFVTDNSVPQKVSLEEQITSGPQPLSVVVLLQTGASASREFPGYAHIGTMLEAMMGTAPFHISLVTFDSQPEEIWDFTRNLTDLQDGFLHPIQGDSGAALFDAVNYGIDLLRQQPPAARRLLLLLSQQQDAGSKVKADDVIRRLGENNVTIYSIAFSPEKAWLKDQFTKPRHGNPSYPMANHESLTGTFDLSTPLGVAFRALQTNAASEIAKLSGGEYLPFNNRSDLEQGLSLFTNHLANRYLLSFHRTTNQPGFHTLQVKVMAHPDLQVSARTSYWAAPEPAH